MIRRIRESEEKSIATVDMEMAAIVDLAVDALAKYSVKEMEYEEGEEPEENQAICLDAEGNEVAVSVVDGVLTIDLDEEDMIEVDLHQDVEAVKAEIVADLEEKLAAQEKTERRGRFENWKRKNLDTRSPGTRTENVRRARRARRSPSRAGSRTENTRRPSELRSSPRPTSPRRPTRR